MSDQKFFATKNSVRKRHWQKSGWPCNFRAAATAMSLAILLASVGLLARPVLAGFRDRFVKLHLGRKSFVFSKFWQIFHSKTKFI
jgi:hypothetical protein